MSILQKKIKKNKLEYFRWLDSESDPDPDSHQNEADPKHCFLPYL